MADQLQRCCWLNGVKKRARVGFPGAVKGPLLLLTSLEAFHLPFQPSEQTLKSSTPVLTSGPTLACSQTGLFCSSSGANLVPTVHSSRSLPRSPYTKTLYKLCNTKGPAPCPDF